MTLDTDDRRLGAPPFLRAARTSSDPGDCLILNDSRVLPARLLGQRLPGGGACEVLLLIDRGDKTWECLVRPGRHMREGSQALLRQRGADRRGHEGAAGRQPSGAL